MFAKTNDWQVVLLCVIGVFTAVATAAGPVLGADGGQHEPIVRPVEQGPAAEFGEVIVESYALEYSVSREEARRRLDRIDVLQVPLALIRGLEAERLAGWGIDHRSGFTGWVLLTGDEPPGSDSIAVADAQSDVEIRFGAQYSYAELLDAQRKLSAELFAARQSADGDAAGGTGEQAQAAPGGSDDRAASRAVASLAEVVTSLGIDMAGNAVRVGIDPALAPDFGPLGSVADLGFDQSAAVVEELLQDHMSVAFEVVDGRGASPAANFVGGVEMSSCTSGFTARRLVRGGYRYGVITAGHCGANGPTETETSSMYGVVLPFVYGWLSATADAQFHRIPDPVSGSHYVADDYVCRDPALHPNFSCDVTGTVARADMPGSYICHAGKNSRVSCGEVIDIDHALEWKKDPCLDSTGAITPCEDVFVKVQGQYLKGCGGDSGGPFYRGGKAYGIMAGLEDGDHDDCDSPGKTAVLSAIEEVEAFLKVEVLTEPVTLGAP